MRPNLDDADLRRYLLGLMPEAEAESLEAAYLGERDTWERLRGAEHDLLDDYAADRLGADEKAAFERRYLASPVLQSRVNAARALRLGASAGSPAPARPAASARSARWALPVALAAGLMLALMAEWGEQPGPSARKSAAASPSPTAPLEPPAPEHTAPTEAADPSSAPSPATRARPASRPQVLALSPVLLRGQPTPAAVRLSRQSELLVLELEGDRSVLPMTPAALVASLETIEGRPVWRGEAGRVTDAGKPSLVATARVPAERLAPGDYLLTLSTHEADATLYRYFFRIRP